MKVVKEGWLYKRSEHIKDWRSRYFILLENGSFVGFKQKPDEISINHPSNNFNIRGCQVMVIDDPKPHTFIIQVLQTTSTIIQRMFHVENEEERMEWVEAIRSTSENDSVTDMKDSRENLSLLGKSIPSSSGKTEVTLESFEFLKVLGKGNFGKVILCREKPTGRLFAIKILKKKTIIQDNEIAHIHTENRVLQKANHPFLTSLKYSFQTNDRLYFVMEYVNGGDLYFHVSREKVFSEDRVRFYGAEIISALAYLHSHNIIYRDLKLENLLLDKDGHIKIADFGLCKEDITYGKTTRTFCGTPEYLAPEILKNNEYGRAVDWWVTGVVMYEMMCGRLPFYNPDKDILFELILREEVKFPKNLSPEAIDLLGHLLIKDPTRRLGNGPDDAEQIKAHPFFSSINWKNLEKKKIVPPFRPQITSDTDTRYFDAAGESVELTPSEICSPLSLSQNRSYFAHFSYQRVSPKLVIS